MRRVTGVRDQRIIIDMKRLTISEVANGWVVSEYGDPAINNPGTTTVWETVEGLQKALPTLLGKPAPADGEQAHHQALLNAAVENLNARGLEVKMEVPPPAPEDPPKKRKVVFDFGQPNQMGGSYDPGTPECHKCKSNEFVIRHPRLPGHWLCERGTCQLDFVV